jgi:hypothetical protein
MSIYQMGRRRPITPSMGRRRPILKTPIKK